MRISDWSSDVCSSDLNLIGARELDMMKAGAVLVNCSRGDVIDEAALAASILEGKIAGPGLDVFADEPPAASGERQNFVQGKSVSVRVDLGGRRIMKYTKVKNTKYTHTTNKKSK